MSDILNNTNTKPKAGHGTAWSYVIGFLLSLVLTAIPYYLVVNKTITGKALLSTILGFAVLQMMVQIFFFLHLGRGPKPLYNVVFFISTVGIILVVVVGSIFIMDNLTYNMSSGDVTTRLAQNESIAQVGTEKTGACQELKNNHLISITGGIVNPVHTDASLCDTLTFVNFDAVAREMAFGPHPEHLVYGGITEVAVRKNNSKTFTLNQLGTHKFHDHDDENVAGDFTVTP